MEAFFAVLDAINGVLLSVPVLLALLAIGLLFTIWSGFCQYRSLTHGVALVAGHGIETDHGPGALTHFQALTAAMSGTVGLGAIAGMAIAVDFGGPGAVFWMWVVGIVGMALKTTEVTLSLLYRDTSEPENPHGGAMYVARDGLAALSPKLRPFGKVIGGLFAVSLMLFAFTGGNMFQTWSVADITREYFGVPTWITGVILAVVAGIVILGGIKRIGNVTKTLVPFKCGVYVLCGLYVIITHADQLPDTFRAIFQGAFSHTDGVGAFVGGTFGSAFMWGMKRALFSSESGLGTAPIAHAAVKRPSRSPRAWSRDSNPSSTRSSSARSRAWSCCSPASGIVARLHAGTRRLPSFESAPGHWQPQLLPEQLKIRDSELPPNPAGTPVFVIAERGAERVRLYGTYRTENGHSHFDWQPLAATEAPKLAEGGVFADYRGSTLVAKGFDSVHPGLGRWLITIAVWVFGLSCIISYGYYGEQGVIYLFGERAVMPFRWLWCVAAAAACFGFIETSGQLDTISTIGMGFMYAINLPLLLILGNQAMRQYHSYFRRLASGEIARKA